MLKKINWPALLVIVFYPLLLVFLGINYYFKNNIGWFEVVLFIIAYYGANISVGIGLHRLWSHHTYKTNKFVEFLLMMISGGTLQGPVLAWASDHNKHHTYTDKELDPHSPAKFDNRLKGFLWSHLGWMLVGEGSYKSIDKVTMVKLGRNKMLVWQLKYYWQVAVFMNLIMPVVVGLLIGKSWHAAYGSFLFIGLGRALQQQMTFCVNSICHFLGSRKYYKGTAGDIWWLAIFLLGENYHNFHHAFPSDYRNGAKWYHFDVHKWIIYLMSKIGLAWDLEWTSEVRVQAKLNEMIKLIEEKRQAKLEFMQIKFEQLSKHFHDKIISLENCSHDFKLKLNKSLVDTQQSLKILKEYLYNSYQERDNLSEKWLKIASAKLKYTEKRLIKLYKNLDKLTEGAFA